MSQDVLLHYAKHAVAPERRVRAFVSADPRFAWANALVDTHKGDVRMTGGTLRDVLLGIVPKHVSVSVDGIAPRKLRNHLNNFGDVTLEGGNEAMSFVPSTAPEATVFIAMSSPDRQDFTVDSLWYSLYWDVLLDEIGGLEDIHNRTIRTVGYPLRTFADDPLATIRALRLAAERQLTFAPETWHALTRSMPRLNRVVRNETNKAEYAYSRHHLGGAMLEMLAAEPRYGAALVHASGLGDMVAPELMKDADSEGSPWKKSVQALGILAHPDTKKSHRLTRLAPVVVLALLLIFHKDALKLAREIARKWHLQQFPADHHAHLKASDLVWLIEHLGHFHKKDPASMAPSAFEKMFGNERGRSLLALMQAVFLSEGKHHVARERLHIARRLLDAIDERRQELPKLVRGRDLTGLGILPGPLYRKLIALVRDAQLAGHLQSKDDALAYLRHHIAHMT